LLHVVVKDTAVVAVGAMLNLLSCCPNAIAVKSIAEDRVAVRSDAKCNESQRLHCGVKELGFKLAADASETLNGI